MRSGSSSAPDGGQRLRSLPSRQDPPPRRIAVAFTLAALLASGFPVASAVPFGSGDCDIEAVLDPLVVREFGSLILITSKDCGGGDIVALDTIVRIEGGPSGTCEEERSETHVWNGSREVRILVDIADGLCFFPDGIASSGRIVVDAVVHNATSEPETRTILSENVVFEPEARMTLDGFALGSTEGPLETRVGALVNLTARIGKMGSAPLTYNLTGNVVVEDARAGSGRVVSSFDVASASAPRLANATWIVPPPGQGGSGEYHFTLSVHNHDADEYRELVATAQNVLRIGADAVGVFVATPHSSLDEDDVRLVGHVVLTDHYGRANLPPDSEAGFGVRIDAPRCAQTLAQVSGRIDREGRELDFPLSIPACAWPGAGEPARLLLRVNVSDVENVPHDDPDTRIQELHFYVTPRFNLSLDSFSIPGSWAAREGGREVDADTVVTIRAHFLNHGRAAGDFDDAVLRLEPVNGDKHPTGGTVLRVDAHEARAGPNVTQAPGPGLASFSWHAASPAEPEANAYELVVRVGETDYPLLREDRVVLWVREIPHLRVADHTPRIVDEREDDLAIHLDFDHVAGRVHDDANLRFVFRVDGCPSKMLILPVSRVLDEGARVRYSLAKDCGAGVRAHLAEERLRIRVNVTGMGFAIRPLDHEWFATVRVTTIPAFVNLQLPYGDRGSTSTSLVLREDARYVVRGEVRNLGNGPFQGYADLYAVAVDSRGERRENVTIGRAFVSEPAGTAVASLAWEWVPRALPDGARAWKLEAGFTATHEHAGGAQAWIASNSLVEIRPVSGLVLDAEAFRLENAFTRLDVETRRGELPLGRALRFQALLANAGNASACCDVQVLFVARDAAGERFNESFNVREIASRASLPLEASWTPDREGRVLVSVLVRQDGVEVDRLERFVDVREIFPYVVTSFDAQDTDPALREPFHVNLTVENRRPDAPAPPLRVIVQEIGPHEAHSRVNESTPGFVNASLARDVEFTPANPTFHVRACVSLEDGRQFTCANATGPHRVRGPFVPEPVFRLLVDNELAAGPTVPGSGNLTIEAVFPRSTDASEWAGELTFAATLESGGRVLARSRDEHVLVTPVATNVTAVFRDVYNLRSLAYACAAMDAIVTLRVEGLRFVHAFRVAPPVRYDAFLDSPRTSLGEGEILALEALLIPRAAGSPTAASLNLTATWDSTPGVRHDVAGWSLAAHEFPCGRNLPLPIPWSPAFPDGHPNDAEDHVTLHLEGSYEALDGSRHPLRADPVRVLVAPRPRLEIDAASAIVPYDADLLRDDSGVVVLPHSADVSSSPPHRLRIVDVLVRNVGHAASTRAFSVTLGEGDERVGGDWIRPLLPDEAVTFRTVLAFDPGLHAVPVEVVSGDSPATRHVRTLHVLHAELLLNGGAPATSSLDLRVRVNAPGARDVAYRIAGDAAWGAFERHVPRDVPFTWPVVLPSRGSYDLTLEALVRARLPDGIVLVARDVTATITYDRDPPDVSIVSRNATLAGAGILSDGGPRVGEIELVLQTNEAASLVAHCTSFTSRLERDDEEGRRHVLVAGSLVPGSYHECAVVATDAWGNEATIEGVSFDIPPVAPGPVTAVGSAYAVLANRLHLVWEPPADNGGRPITAYVVVERDEGGDCRVVHREEASASSTAFHVDRRGRGDYTRASERAYAVVAVNGHGDPVQEACYEVQGHVLVHVVVQTHVLPLILAAAASVILLVGVLAAYDVRRRDWQARYLRVRDLPWSTAASQHAPAPSLPREAASAAFVALRRTLVRLRVLLAAALARAHAWRLRRAVSEGRALGAETATSQAAPESEPPARHTRPQAANAEQAPAQETSFTSASLQPPQADDEHPDGKPPR